MLSFSDPQGGITRAPISETWPLQMLNIVTFSERDDRTTVTLRGRAINTTDEERATYVAGFEFMQGRIWRDVRSARRLSRQSMMASRRQPPTF